MNDARWRLGASAAPRRLGFPLLAELVQRLPDRNVLISPAGLLFTLLMVYNGAGGGARVGLATALGLHGWEADDVNHGAAALRAALEQSGPRVELTIANALWANSGFAFAPPFVQRVEHFYAAQAQVLAFGDPAAAETINSWVSHETGAKITRLVDRADLAPPAECVLTNAVYFRGLWAAPFAPGSTREGRFTLVGGQQKTVPMMAQSGRFAYLETGTFQAISLPYGDGRFSMVVLLPAAGVPLQEVLHALTAEGWEARLAQLRPTRVDLALPRAALTYGADVAEPLAALGMGSAFAPGADLAPMGLGGGAITAVKHQARVEIREEGTQAAAASAVVVGRALIGPAAMVVDRPFFCAIRDRTSEALLFMGVVLDPE